jgi:hypothetical protein
MILARPYMTGWARMVIKSTKAIIRLQYELSQPYRIFPPAAYKPSDLYTTFGRPIHTPDRAYMDLGSTVTYPINNVTQKQSFYTNLMMNYFSFQDKSKSRSLSDRDRNITTLTRFFKSL